MTEYLRMSGMYWGLTALDLMGTLQNMDREEIIKYVVNCQHESGGIRPSPGHDPHLLYTLSGIQVVFLIMIPTFFSLLSVSKNEILFFF